MASFTMIVLYSIEQLSKFIALFTHDKISHAMEKFRGCAQLFDAFIYGEIQINATADQFLNQLIGQHDHQRMPSGSLFLSHIMTKGKG